MTEAERELFLFLARWLGRSRAVAALAELDVTKFSDIPEKSTRVALLKSLMQELFNDATD